MHPFKMFLIAVSVLLCMTALTWYFLIMARPQAKFTEETRRQVYEESVTAQTACRREVTNLYREWAKAETPAHQRALELAAIGEADRARCDGSVWL